MKITLSQFAGFCDGVRRAFDVVNNLDSDSLPKPIYVLGSLVHNADVVKKIEAKGIKKIDLETFNRAKPGEIGTLIITAHGSGPKIYESAAEKKINIVDTTCPRVIKVQRLAKNFIEKGLNVILIGDRDHKEVRSIFEWGAEKLQIISDEDDLDRLNIDVTKKTMILSQTTQNKDFVAKIESELKKRYADIEITDTICLATEQRQDEVRKLARENDATIVIGSPESANSNRLYEIAKVITSDAFFIERSDQLEKGRLVGLEKVLVTAGASTPDWIIEGVIKELNDL